MLVVGVLVQGGGSAGVGPWRTALVAARELVASLSPPGFLFRWPMQFCKELKVFVGTRRKRRRHSWEREVEALPCVSLPIAVCLLVCRFIGCVHHGDDAAEREGF